MSAGRRLQHTSTESESEFDTLQSVGDTVGTFAHRLARKLKEQEVQQDETEKRREARHALILQAMTTIRKALAETSKIKLGDRFHFQLEVNDWEGWPRVELVLVDTVAPERVDFVLDVTANDRSELGTVLMKLNTSTILGKLQLQDPREFKRLPVVLKRAVRHFLDVVASYVLNPKKPEELIEVQTKNLSPDENLDPLDSALKATDVFSDDSSYTADNVIRESDDEPRPLSAAPEFN